jgi:hypothetical protein
MTTQQSSNNTSKKWSDLFDKQTAPVQTQDGSKVIATIEIHHQEQSQAQPTNTKKHRDTQVKPEALKIATFLYTTQLDNITKTKTRPELEKFYLEHTTAEIQQQLFQLGIGFSEVLYALARGMKVVNVFRSNDNTEQEMGWHKPEQKYCAAHKESKKRLHPQSDGFTFIGKPPLPEIEPVVKKTEVVVEKPVEVAPSTHVDIVQKPTYHADENDFKLSDDAIIDHLKSIKSDIENHHCAIESLVPLHDDHCDKITILSENPCDVAKRVVNYHKHARDELKKLLDTLHFELEGMKSRKVWLCEQLKN